MDSIKRKKTLWHTLSVDETVSRLSGNLSAGLSEQQAVSRLSRFGSNTLTEVKKDSFWGNFFEELREPMVLLLLATGVLYAIWGEFSEAITLFVIILLLNTIEVLNEQRSRKAIASLHKLAEPMTAVWRNDRFHEIKIDQVVPGDLILLRRGHRVPADARLVEAYGLSIDESALTGESLPVQKKAQTIVDAESPPAEWENMVFSSTLVERGKGKAIVVSTGMQTEVGRIAGLAQNVKEPRTPLQNMMEELSKVLVWFALGFSVVLPLVGIFLAHQPPKQMLLTGLSLAFATIPEELPILITMTLALGAFRLSKKQAVSRRLKGVETLGAVTTIATDKTGTLTQNRMQVARCEPQEFQRQLLEIGILCSDAAPDRDGFQGDALDVALLQAAKDFGLDVIAERTRCPMLNEFTFDNEHKRMATLRRKAGQPWLAVKGAPESILPQCTQWQRSEGIKSFGDADRQSILAQVDRMAADGLRVLAFAERILPHADLPRAVAESELTFVGLVGLHDPPRPEARQAVAACQRAGVRVLMITGDHPLTARAIARQAGLDDGQDVITGPMLDKLSEVELGQWVQDNTIFARTTPEHKLRIVQALQRMGERVAVTGDGVNDAPALSAADIGVSMGASGTDVAREASDMVLLDDNFSTLTHAVEEGRLVYDNLKKGVRFYLTCKLALVLINLFPPLFSVPVPFEPVQIILMELFLDLMAAASFSAEAPESDLMDQKPRNPGAKFMDKTMIFGIFSSAMGLFISITTIYLFTWFTTQDMVTSQTVAFFGWLVGHVFLAFNMRSERQPIYKIGWKNNPLMLVWGGLVAIFLVAVSILPALQDLMRTAVLNGGQWALILLTTFAGTFWIEVKKTLSFKLKQT